MKQFPYPFVLPILLPQQSKTAVGFNLHPSTTTSRTVRHSTSGTHISVAGGALTPRMSLEKRNEGIFYSAWQTKLRTLPKSIVQRTSSSSSSLSSTPTVVKTAALLLVTTIGFLSFSVPPAVAATTTAAAPATNLPIRLGWKNLSSAALLVVTTCSLGLGIVWKQSQLAKSLLQAAVRCSIQLQMVGGLVLTHFLVAANTRPWMVLLWIVSAGTLAAQEAAARLQYTYPNLKRHLALSILFGSGIVMGAAAQFQILGPVQPWFAPRTWIPISGMLIGNSLTAAGLAVASWTQEIASTRRSAIELRLARGASWKEACQSTVQSSLTAALTPTMNALPVTGIVHLPGMMTGQILAGQSPNQAAAYQVLIFFLIATASTIAVLSVLGLASRETVDKENHRLAPSERLVPVVSSSSSSSSSSAALNRKNRNNNKRDQTCMAGIALPFACLLGRQRKQRPDGESMVENVDDIYLLAGTNDSETNDNVTCFALPKQRTTGTTGSNNTAPHPPFPVLRVDNMKVARMKMQISLDLHPGGRIGLKGPSGAGKSQILRTIATLEPQHQQSRRLGAAGLELCGQQQRMLSLPEWRRRVALVPQDRPALEGTPYQFYQEVCNFHSQKQHQHPQQQKCETNDTVGNAGHANGHGKQTKKKDPSEIASAWGLAASAFDQSWSTLSGGEAQRASLAIALALEPDLLLLDESTSALDEPTTLKVEQTIRDMGIPVLMVSHSIAQMERFCTDSIDLAPMEPAPV